MCNVDTNLTLETDVFIINPCPLSTITKLMATTVASNFRSLFEFDNSISLASMVSTSLTSSSQQQQQQQSQATSSPKSESKDVKIHNETITTMENFARASFGFGFWASSKEEDPRIAISVLTNCAYTIQVIGMSELSFYFE